MGKNKKWGYYVLGAHEGHVVHDRREKLFIDRQIHKFPMFPEFYNKIEFLSRKKIHEYDWSLVIACNN